MPEAIDPRVAEALRLLQSAIADPLDAAGAAVSPTAWSEGTASFDLASATDLLTMWLPAGSAPALEAGSRWDALHSGRAIARDAAATTGPAREPEGLHAILPEHVADAVIDALFSFAHALSKRELGAAMRLVSEDFHCVHRDRERDHAGFRQLLEQRLDRPGFCELEVTWVYVPEAIAHRAGVLVHNTLQFDYRRGDGTPGDTALWEGVWLFAADRQGTWQIHSFSELGGD